MAAVLVVSWPCAAELSDLSCMLLGMNDAPTDLQILDLEARWFRRPGAREQAVADELGLTLTAYARRLLAIVEAPTLEVVERYGPLVRRLGVRVAADRAKRSPRRVA